MTGRPTIYSDEIAGKICNRLMEGESLVSICEDKDLPSTSTVYNWLNDLPEFVDKYTRAREVQAERYADEIVKLSDNNEGDIKSRGLTIERNKLQIETRKWVASKLLPKKYGSFKSVEVKGEVENKTADLSHLTFEQLYELKHGRKPE